MKPLSGCFQPEWLYWQGRLWYRPVIELAEGHLRSLNPLGGTDATPLEGLLSPAWTNAHTHLELSHLRGRLPQGRGMIAFLEAMGPQRGQAFPSQIYAALEEAAYEGTWAFASHQNSPLPLEALPAGVEVQPLGEFFGLSPRRARRRLRATSRLGYPLTPHSLYALSRPLLRVGRRRTPFPRSVHFFESLEERLWLCEGRGPFKVFFRRFVRVPAPPRWVYWLRQWYRKAPALWLVHTTEAPEGVLETLLTRYPRLYGVLCPLANRYLFRRSPNVDFWKRWPGRFLLGTDSLANAPSLSLWPVVRYLVQAGLPWELVLQAAADTPRTWIKAPLHWVQIHPLRAALGLDPATKAHTLSGE